MTLGHATGDDLRDIVALLADDPHGAARERLEDPLPEAYRRAFEAIEADPNNELIVARDGAAIIGVLQLTFIPNLTYRGGWRCLVEGVRVDRAYRSRGVGRHLLTFAISRADDRGCHMVQLTTDKARPRAIQFYETLGFRPSHVGMKLHLRRAHT